MLYTCCDRSGNLLCTTFGPNAGGGGITYKICISWVALDAAIVEERTVLKCDGPCVPRVSSCRCIGKRGTEAFNSENMECLILFMKVY